MQEQVIIKKKRRKGHEEAPHSGAWKVAYADFVTAMMAFFLLMWILASVSADKRREIADFFQSGVPLAELSGGALSPLGGEQGAATVEVERAPVQQDGQVMSPQEASELNEIAEKLAGGDSLESDLMRRHVAVRLSDEGMVIILSALPDAPLFSNDYELMPLAKMLLGVIARQLDGKSSGIAIAGHLPPQSVMTRSGATWLKSLSRAETARSALVAAGLDENRLRRVSGHADRAPEGGNFERIEITVLRAGA